jgi:glutamine synthetase
VVAAAADGIKRRLTPPAAIEGDAYARGELPELPGSLESAIQAFQADDAFRRALDERFSDYFVISRAWEVKAFRQTVTDWERDRYMRTV